MKSKALIVLTLLIFVFMGYVSIFPIDKSALNETDAAPLNSGSFDGKKVVQIGIVVNDVEKYAKSYAEFFGVDVPPIIMSETEDKAKTQYHDSPTQARVKQAFFHFENISIELLEPVGEPSTWKDFLENNGEGVHHIAFEVKEMDDHISKMQDRGINLIQQGQWTTYSGGRYAYFDSTPQLAVMLELLENF